ncbi:MAG: transglycosylase SLT domain-containing protein [Sphingomonadales bacterium]
MFAAVSAGRSGWAAHPDAGSRTAPGVAADPMAVLSPEDADRYHRIFALQENAKWRKADKLIKKLDDRLLMGHVLFQRYMHPTGYRSRYSELSAWLDKYADHPGANRIYQLARKRKPRKARAPKKPLRAVARIAAKAGPKGATPASTTRTKRQQSAAKRREISSLKSRIARYLRRNKVDEAEKRLWASRRSELLEPAAFDSLLARIAEKYFYLGQDEKALALAQLATRSRGRAEQADWIAGLAAWRLGDPATAAIHFEALSSSQTASPWTIAAAGYWAARAHLISGQPDKVNRLLAIAAVHPRTFYGLIATRQLGIPMNHSWDAPPLDPADYLRVVKEKGVRRAIALVQAGQSHRADQDLRLLAWRADDGLYPALLGIAARLKLPATQLALSDLLAEGTAGSWDSVRYPVPDWEPEGGFSLDKAVLFAVIRQESRFNSRAISSAGARGLMQLMPGTASFIAHDRSLRHVNKTKLYTPDFNMALGQRYLEHLVELDYIDRNMFLVVGAYHGGPGNISRWLRNVRHGDDWLLFIETIPGPRTRDYIEKVLSNLWIYRMRLGQPTPTLDAVATGDWPLYTALDNTIFKAADADSMQEPSWPESMNTSLFSLSLLPY